jgi:hypothetical protein
MLSTLYYLIECLNRVICYSASPFAPSHASSTLDLGDGRPDQPSPIQFAAAGWRQRLQTLGRCERAKDCAALAARQCDVAVCL